MAQHRASILCAATLAAACLPPAVARADEPAAPAAAAPEGPETVAPGPPIKDPDRKGGTVGLSFGVGEMHIFPGGGGSSITAEGPGVAVRAGWCFGQSVLGLLMVDLVTANSQTNALLGGGFQFYVSKRVFLRLGAGLGRLSSSSSSSSTGTTMTMSSSTPTKLGVAGHGGFGVDFFQLQHLALDGEFVTTTNKVVGDTSAILNLSLMVGAQWF
jgi:hypothetical protein